MASDLGTKHLCFKCDAKFYDLKKPVPICPKCGADQRDAPPPGTRTRRPAAAKPGQPDLDAPAVDADDEKEDDDEEDEDDE